LSTLAAGPPGLVEVKINKNKNMTFAGRANAPENRQFQASNRLQTGIGRCVFCHFQVAGCTLRATLRQPSAECRRPGFSNNVKDLRAGSLGRLPLIVEAGFV